MSKTVLTLIAPRGKGNLAQSLVAKLAARAAKEGALPLKTEWLAENEACDLTFARIESEILDALARDALRAEPVDAIAQPAENRQKRLLITDMDSTIITVECIDEIADFAGVKEQVAAITERAMRGEMDFAEALDARVMLLKGLDQSLLARVYDERVRFMPGGKALVATMRAHGAYAVLVSGGFDFFTSRVKSALGFDADASNRLEIASGALTGRVIPPILDKSAKVETLLRMAAEQGLGRDDTLAVGDGANDLPMLMVAGLGVAYHAKPVVQQSARARLNHTDLSALLFAQGYRREEWTVPPGDA